MPYAIQYTEVLLNDVIALSIVIVVTVSELISGGTAAAEEPVYLVTIAP